MEKKKILVIDDNPVIIRLDKALLRSAGFEVITATEGEQGLKLAREENPAAILLDIILPGIHGFELCKTLKSDPATQAIPVILVTGSGLEEVAEQEPDIPADGIITKPYGIKELEEALIRVNVTPQ